MLNTARFSTNPEKFWTQSSSGTAAFTASLVFGARSIGFHDSGEILMMIGSASIGLFFFVLTAMFFGTRCEAALSMTWGTDHPLLKDFKKIDWKENLIRGALQFVKLLNRHRGEIPLFGVHIILFLLAGIAMTLIAVPAAQATLSAFASH